MEVVSEIEIAVAYFDTRKAIPFCITLLEIGHL